MKHTIFLFVVIIMFQNQAGATPPQQADSLQKAFAAGMWLCDTPASADNLSSNARTSAQAGVTITPTVLDDIARNEIANSGKSLCAFVESEKFKPLLPDKIHQSFLDGGLLLVSDGKHNGWVTAIQYANYMVYHVVRKL